MFEIVVSIWGPSGGECWSSRGRESRADALDRCCVDAWLRSGSICWVEVGVEPGAVCPLYCWPSQECPTQGWPSRTPKVAECETQKQSFAESYFNAFGAVVILAAELRPGVAYTLQAQLPQGPSGRLDEADLFLVSDARLAVDALEN